MQTILSQAIELLGPPVKPDDGRGWCHWWCPFHPDAERAGRRGQPNFGINVVSDHGYWKCLRCGVRGGSLAALRRKLPGARPQGFRPVEPRRRKSGLEALDEAIAETRSAVMRSPAWDYIQSRGVRPPTSLTYGLGYGVPDPMVGSTTRQLAETSRLVRSDGTWLWAGGVVYADPPTVPRTIQVRHLRPGAGKKYQTWGKLAVPLGAWRLKPGRHQILIVVEGMFDMLSMAQALQDRRLENVLPVYTGGAAVSRAMLDWFKDRPQYGYVLIPDDDDAGRNWTRALAGAIKAGGGVSFVSSTPAGLDPDEALMQGWWPDGL
jgi:hypothetical protein